MNQEPECIEVVKSVGDYKTWLVKAVGVKQFSGFAKRVSDQHRPHQMISRRCAVTTETPHGVCFDYKNLSVDRTIWNLGQAPIVLLNGLPDEAGPVMQTPQTHAGQKGHLERLASQKEGITNLWTQQSSKTCLRRKTGTKLQICSTHFLVLVKKKAYSWTGMNVVSSKKWKKTTNGKHCLSAVE